MARKRELIMTILNPCTKETLQVPASVVNFLDRAGVCHHDDEAYKLGWPIAPSKPYNGWPNHATWMVHLHIGNQESTYNHARNLAAHCKRESANHPNIKSGVWTVEETQRITLAEAMKEWIGANCHVNGRDSVVLDQTRSYGGIWPSLMNDLITSYLQDVDWQRIAEPFLED